MHLSISSLIFKDNLSLYFVMLVILISMPVFIYSLGFVKEFKNKYSITYLWTMMILFVGAMIGVVVSANSISFIFFWELMSVCSFLLVTYEYKNKENIRSGVMYFIMTHLSGLFIMLMFGTLYRYTGELDFRSIAQKTGLLSEAQKMTVLLLGLAGFGTKAGLMPLHAWLPKAHPAAPSNVPALTSGVMLKISIYGFIRLTFVLFKEIPLSFAILVMLIGAISAVYAILNGLFQNDIKKLLAYSSAENIGIIFSTLGLSMIFNHYGIDELGLLALTAALFHILNHAIFKSLLFSSAGSVMYGTGSKNMNELGGISTKMRITAFCAFVGTAAIAAIPPLNGFSSELLIFKSFIEAGNAIKSPETLILTLISGIILAITSGMVVWASVKFFGITFLGAPRSIKARETREIPKSMNVGMAILSVYAIITGVFAPFFIERLSWLSNSIRDLNLDISGNTFGYEITLISVVLILMIVVLVLIGKASDKGKTIEVNDSWGCGFHALKPHMQYTGSGLSQPAARFIGVLSCYEKEVRIKNTIFLKQRFEDIIEKYIYTAVIKGVGFISGRVIKIHHGKIQAYISYIFVSLIIALVLVIQFV